MNAAPALEQRTREVYDHLCALHAAAHDHGCQECIGHAEALLAAWNEGRIAVVGDTIDLIGRPA